MQQFCTLAFIMASHVIKSIVKMEVEEMERNEVHAEIPWIRTTPVRPVVAKSVPMMLSISSGSEEYETLGSSGAGSVAGLAGIMEAKSTEFSYQELAKATNNFSLDHKIGQGGFGAVYYAELIGGQTTIKKMPFMIEEIGGKGCDQNLF